MTANKFTAGIFLVFAIVVLGVWIPNDVETGLLEKMRRHWVIGDSLAPTLASGFVLIGAALILLFEKRDEAQFTMAAAQFVFFLKLVIVILVALSVMRHLGPILVNTYVAISGLDLEYRLLRDMIGIKHIGFLIGGVIMVGGMITVVEGRLSRRALIIGLIWSLVLILVYDLPFEDLLLPPNGDV
jgi:hypothetical protein